MEAHPHLSTEQLTTALRSVAPPPHDLGCVELVVARPVSEQRLLPASARLTPEGGLEGDRWGAGRPVGRDNQVTLIWGDFARLVAAGQPVELCGDNLIVDLDLSEANLPAGTMLRIGGAVCSVTPLPHTGCGKFERRFGKPARAILSSPEFAPLRLRGIHVQVIEEGTVAPGDEIVVLSRT